MQKKDLRTENDNLKIFRDKKSTLTEQLLRRSLDELIQLKAVINQKTVCAMMDNLANSKEKEFKAIISPSAISKNEIYKNMILEAKEKVQLSDESKKLYKLDGDKKLEVFQLKTIIARKEAKIKELESIIERANIKDNTNIYSTYDNINYKYIVSDLKNYVMHEGISYIDNDGNLIDESTGNILIASRIVESL